MKTYNLTLTFTDRETYLAWRRQWKTEYKEISQTIRDLKFCRKTKLDEAGKARVEAITKRPDLCGAYGFNLYGNLWKLQAKATEYIELRKASKVRAQEQYLAAKAKAA
jgi:hypothetical protein